MQGAYEVILWPKWKKKDAFYQFIPTAPTPGLLLLSLRIMGLESLACCALFNFETFPPIHNERVYQVARLYFTGKKDQVEKKTKID